MELSDNAHLDIGNNSRQQPFWGFLIGITPRLRWRQNFNQKHASRVACIHNFHTYGPFADTFRGNQYFHVVVLLLYESASCQPNRSISVSLVPWFEDFELCLNGGFQLGYQRNRRSWIAVRNFSTWALGATSIHSPK